MVLLRGQVISPEHIYSVEWKFNTPLVYARIVAFLAMRNTLLYTLLRMYILVV